MQHTLVKTPGTTCQILVKHISTYNLSWNKSPLYIDMGRKPMSRDRYHDWDAQDHIEVGYVDDDSSSSEDVANATKYVPTSLRSPVKLLSRAQNNIGSIQSPTECSNGYAPYL